MLTWGGGEFVIFFGGSKKMPRGCNKPKTISPVRCSFVIVYFDAV